MSQCEVVVSSSNDKLWNIARPNGGYSVGVHLFPFRTEQLSPIAPMVLQSNVEE